MIAHRPSSYGTYDCPLCGDPVHVPGQRCPACIRDAVAAHAARVVPAKPAKPLTPRVRKCRGFDGNGCEAMVTSQASRCKSCARAYWAVHKSYYNEDYKAVWRRTKAKNAARLPEPDAVADALIQIVSDRHGVAVEYIHATCRKKSAGMVKARRLVVLALRCGGYSYPRIGRQLGYRDHTAAWVSAHAATEDEKAAAAELWREACGKVKEQTGAAN